MERCAVNRIRVSGDALDGIDDGELTFQRAYFPADTGCSNGGADKAKMELDIIGLGYYVKSGNSNNRDGAMMTTMVLNVTAYSDTWVSNLNNPTTGCPCSSAWTKGAWRALASCKTGTCPGRAALFGNGTLATPGYGRMRTAHGHIQRTNVMETEDEGITTGQYTMESFPLKLASTENLCDNTETKNICGRFDQPCHEAPGGIYHYTQLLELPAYYGLFDDKYDYRLEAYGEDASCLSGPQYTVEHTGKIWLAHETSLIGRGEPVELHPSVYTVNVWTEDAAAQLNVLCPCGGIWTVGTPRTIASACPAGSCIDHSWARGPPGAAKMYGNIRKTGSFMRWSMMSADKATGYATGFTDTDFAMFSMEGTAGPCETPP